MEFNKGKFADGTKPLFSTFISCEIPMGSPYDFGVCELVEVLMHAPLVGFGAPPWVSDIAGSTNFV